MTDKRLLGAIATTRFGLGARAGEIDEAAGDPIGWVLAQTDRATAPRWPGALHSSELLNEARRIGEMEPVARLRHEWFAVTLRGEQAPEAVHACTTAAPFRERWAMFWRNHFALKLGASFVDLIGTAFAREALDPHLFGRFEDMAAAAARHPAMLMSLDQVGSVGPNSTLGRAHNRGLNENLARETLELHTLGVKGGYDQGDVTELAKALTGWSLGEGVMHGRFVNDPARREPGPRRILNQTWPETDDRAEQIVRTLARKPATAEHLAVKLARHFVADEPPADLVKGLRTTFLSTGGDLGAVAKALVTAPEAWVREQRKFKTPVEFVTSVHRAAGTLPEEPATMLGAVRDMGQLWFCARTPDGHSDRAAAWATPQGLALRAHYAWTHAHKSAALDSREFTQTALGPLAQGRTKATVASRAGGDRPNAFALVAMSPEFQRR
ncbi:MAG: DUF1800 domain-containing protein [Proteobacteria bacterium]|nr:DUF1800 domain-containing protein [Pseudomonadota bacterium]